MTGTLRALGAAALTAVVALTATACGHDDTPAPVASVEPSDHHGPPVNVSAPAMPPLPAPWQDVDQYDADAIMRAAVTAMFSWTPATDASPRDAVMRARPLLDDRYVSSADASFVAMSPVTGAEWDGWKAAGARGTASMTVASDEHPADRQGYKARVVQVRVELADASGRHLDTKTFTAYAVVTLMGVWRLSGLQVR